MFVGHRVVDANRGSERQRCGGRGRLHFDDARGRYQLRLAERSLAPQGRVSLMHPSRSFTRGTPRGLFGNIGLMAAHAWSVSS